MTKKKSMIRKKKKTIPKADGIPVHCSHTKIVPTASLTPNPENHNHHPPKQIALLALIIAGQGWRNPIVVSRRSGFIVKGHCRLMAAQRLGVTEVPIDEQNYKNVGLEHADLIADNHIAELAEPDKGMLKDLLQGIDTGEVDMDLTGYLPDELEDLMTESPTPDQQNKGEVEFTEELLESHNYVVLYFDNDIDWLQAETLMELKPVKALHSKKGFEAKGIGRVLRGPDAIARILKNSQ